MQNDDEAGDFLDLQDGEDGTDFAPRIVIGQPLENAEQFEAMFGGVYPLCPIEFEDEEGTTVHRADPKAVTECEFDFQRRLRVIWAAHSLGPDLAPSASDAERVARAAQFKMAITHYEGHSR